MLFKNILVVCIGNICRSPMAEGLLKHALVACNKDGCTVSSAGLSALTGHPPDPKACQLMIEKGIDISYYRACQLNKEMIRKADLILVMESAHKIAELDTIGAVLTAAIQAEKDSILFYDELARQAKFDVARNIFEILKKEEQGHVVKLKTMIEEWA